MSDARHFSVGAFVAVLFVAVGAGGLWWQSTVPISAICDLPQGAPSYEPWEACVRKWSFRLAGAPDAASTIAVGVLTACRSEISAAVVDEPLAKQRKAPKQCVSRMSKKQGRARYFTLLGHAPAIARQFEAFSLVVEASENL